ncbi:MAG: protein-glutamate O-methyltransferase CheR [Gemmatimonadales bacterium]|nr:protein-glutamate O-methyltransferase CheR [Gemmatimonadales bacterium]
MTAVPEDVEWKLLADLVRDRMGLQFDGGRRELLASKLRPRLRDLHLRSFTEYYHYLRFHPSSASEFRNLATHVTNNETYFFREAHQFDLLVRNVIPPLMPSLRARPLRLLSAGCSSGEEAYSLVIALQNSGLELGGLRWTIDGCDVSADRIARARAGVYDEIALRACDAGARARYFTPRDGRFQLKDRHRKGVTFQEANLADSAGAVREGYHAIFCRNLLIYFSPDAFDQLIARFARWLEPGGYLFLGHSESLIDRGSAFLPVCLGQHVVYRKLA